MLFAKFSVSLKPGNLEKNKKIIDSLKDIIQKIQ
jgi:hypothetical protein